MQSSSINNDIANKLSNIISKINFISEDEKSASLSNYIYYLLKASETSDPKTKASIENNIVKIGEDAIPALIESLKTMSGTVRGLVAMTLIRIGKTSINLLEQSAKETPDFSWISEYIINEINGTQVALVPVRVESFDTALVS